MKTLAEVEAQMKALADKAKLTVGDVAEALAIPAEPAFDTEAALYDSNGNPPFSGVPEAPPAKRPGGAMCNPIYNDGVPMEDCARLLASALSRRGLKIAEAAQATGLTPAQVRSTADSLPGQFEQKGGRIHLIS